VTAGLTTAAENQRFSWFFGMGYLVGAGFRVGAFGGRTTITENATAGLTAPDSGVNRLQPFLENGNSSLRGHDSNKGAVKLPGTAESM
jgi:hypothetical protein